MVYADNVICWFDAISDKIKKNRELKSSVYALSGVLMKIMC